MKDWRNFVKTSEYDRRFTKCVDWHFSVKVALCYLQFANKMTIRSRKSLNILSSTFENVIFLNVANDPLKSFSEMH